MMPDHIREACDIVDYQNLSEEERNMSQILADRMKT
jgi:hypothetical protein